MTTKLTLTALLLIVPACSDDVDHGHDTSITDTSGDTRNGDASSDADASNDTSPTDTAPDVPDVPHDPVACRDGQACSAPLDGDGLCAATCVTLVEHLGCPGEVVHATCRTTGVVAASPTSVELGDIRVEAIDMPSDAEIGESVNLIMRVTNLTDHALDVPFSARTPDTWDIRDASWDGVSELHLGEHASTDLTATIEARTVTVLMNGPGIIGSFSFGDRGLFEPAIAVHFKASEPIACGDEHFPATWCADPETCQSQHVHYQRAVCCDDVFYPGANCCTSDDCSGARCIDGQCTAQAPNFPTANTLPVGRQRILLVLVDEHPELASDPCLDHADTLAGPLDLARVGAFYDDLATRRFGQPTMELAWTVRTGIATADFLGSAGFDWASYSGALAAWFEDQGCPMRDAFDKVIVSSPALDLQFFGGIYFGSGEIGVKSATEPLLLAHELGHSFGANDLYLDLGGSFQYAGDLMGNALSGEGFPGDHVMWGEIGFGDVDGSGVIDLVEYAARPSELVLTEPYARITRKDALEIGFGLGARELTNGPVLALLTNVMHVRLPIVGFDTDSFGNNREKTFVFDATQVDLDAVLAAGTLELGVSVDYRYTDHDWQPVKTTLEQTLHIPVVDERPE